MGPIDPDRGVGNGAARRVGLTVLTILVSCQLACQEPSRWRAREEPTMGEAGIVLSHRGAGSLASRLRPREMPPIPMRANLRSCCAFGSEIGTTLGPVPIPFYRIPNLISRTDLGPHTYDSGVVVGPRDGEMSAKWNEENNGLVYTCRGGFIDTAHVRDYVDWTVWIAVELTRRAHRAGVFRQRLTDEAGERWITFEPPPRALVDEVGFQRLYSRMAEWLGFQLSTWHEIATWYGWESIKGFPEKVSAFSPEDVYSNVLGVRLVAALSQRRAGRTEHLYNQAVTAWLDATLAYLGALPSEYARRVVLELDGHWWDSRVRVPDNALVLKRKVSSGGHIVPWVAPDALLSQELRDDLDRACGNDREPHALDIDAEVDGIAFSDYVGLEIVLDDDFAERPPFAEIGPIVRATDFPTLVERVREEIRAELGPRADRPD